MFGPHWQANDAKADRLGPLRLVEVIDVNDPTAIMSLECSPHVVKRDGIQSAIGTSRVSKKCHPVLHLHHKAEPAVMKVLSTVTFRSERNVHRIVWWN